MVTVDSDTGQHGREADEPRWEVDPPSTSGALRSSRPWGFGARRRACGFRTSHKRQGVARTWSTKLRAASGIELYVCSSIPGLLQTPEHARALLACWQPAYSEEDLESRVAARMARRAVYDCRPVPALGFVLGEATLRRRVGGTMVR